MRRPEPDRAGDGPDRLWQPLAQALSSGAHLVPQPLDPIGQGIDAARPIRDEGSGGKGQ
ncbi:hypothetical protein ACFU9X_43225 [Streptomyces atratus]|uniref:hypothetical protein n=1 Tax=Streptomyces atratus TaxID=1893 RepID=UPI0036A7F955